MSWRLPPLVEPVQRHAYRVAHSHRVDESTAPTSLLTSNSRSRHGRVPRLFENDRNDRNERGAIRGRRGSSRRRDVPPRNSRASRNGNVSQGIRLDAEIGLVVFADGNSPPGQRKPAPVFQRRCARSTTEQRSVLIKYGVVNASVPQPAPASGRCTPVASHQGRGVDRAWSVPRARVPVRAGITRFLALVRVDTTGRRSGSFVGRPGIER